MLTKQQILQALSTWIKQRPGLEFGNYGSLAPYRAELRQIAKDKRDAEQLLQAVALRDSITAADLAKAFSAYSGRLSLSEDKHGAARLDYCTGQYWPTEYRKAAAAVLASALWEHVRFSSMPQPEYKLGDGVTFDTEKEAREYAEEMHREQNCVLGIEEKYDNISAGDWIRRYFRREFGRSIQQRWFS